MKFIISLLLIVYIATNTVSAETYFVRLVSLNLEPFEEVLENFIIPFAHRKGYSERKGYISVEFEGEDIIVVYNYDFSQYCCWWEDKTSLKSVLPKTGVSIIGGHSIRVIARKDCPYVETTNRILRYNYDCSDYVGIVGIYDGEDFWRFRYSQGVLTLKQVGSLGMAPPYDRMIPPGYTLDE